MALASGQAPDHRGFLYRVGRLAESVLPIVLPVLERGHHLVVALDADLAASLRENLDARWNAQLSFASPRTESPVRSVPTSQRIVLLRRFPSGPTAATACGPDDRVVPTGVTLLCACPYEAPSDVLTIFRHRHRHALTAHPPAAEAAPKDRPVTIGAIAFSRLEELAAVRALLRRAAGAAGFGSDARECFVLAVHEVAVVACRLVGPPGDATRGGCSLQAFAERGRLVVEMELRRGAELPSPTRDGDPFRWVRFFSGHVTFSGSPRTRRLRIESCADGE